MKLSTIEIQNKLNGHDYSYLPKPGKNKGKRGQLLEQVLGIQSGSSLTDLIDGELKTFTIGETIAVTQIKHCLQEIIDDCVDFENSKVFQKLKQTIYVGFTTAGEFVNSKTINQENSPEHYQKLAEDYNFISDRIKEAFDSGNKLKTINGPNKLLQIRTKASKNSRGFYVPLTYKNIQLKDKYMAFYLRSTFGREIAGK